MEQQISNINFVSKEKDIFFYALGGLGEIGKNMYVFEIQKQIFIIDAGISFFGDSFLGINYVIPNYEYLLKNEERIVALFITHGHEDHIGGIPFLLKKIKIPQIFVSGIAFNLIEVKLIEHKLNKYIQKMTKYFHDSKFQFDQTEISFIRMNHSIPDSFGIVLNNQNRILFYTGDFKIDHTPVGPLAEYDKLLELSKKNVLCLFSDSTNSQKKGNIQSESEIGKTINQLFYKIKGRIIIVTFASNFYRIKQIIEASILTGRKIAIFGRSMEKSIETGIKNNYLKIPKGIIVSGNDIDKYVNITLICTGSQGEPLAALSRMAQGIHRQIKLLQKDTVIFSSSPIPGNQDSINKILDLLLKMDIEVITHGAVVNTHTSGHASQNDLKLLINLIKPKFFIPVHGEYIMLMAHKKLAIECQINPENIFILDNGEVMRINEQSITKINKIEAKSIYIDDSGTENIDSSILKERKILSEEGLFSIIISLNFKYKKILNLPMIFSRGFIYMKSNKELMKKISLDIKKYIQNYLHKIDKIDKNDLKKSIIDFVTPKIYELTLRNPIIIPIILKT
ncbi:MAG: ribonuclease J [Candidatus Phytoplasma stylosanthis]|uniref:ribonuclease J n=1 Tax=Candidatus Phytoplasma stylosanthis TaxID=2798314 RepID=UPI00293A6380|nr:ribonuclease J [Candidatus Phytoplasma stylosanthis]MDV3167995.1 ribonuclease J [Candidatus Phytoplasma stylosanthis]MDV3171065.1 ribonuclease J [Candidatus Phytoplasma stylosanthis]MDV3174273.1 ribonuclease J [Candidatus Phytoplasma stylosanthis]MDV3202613.1 ribonuclease J [Candidatus Phytoplasma stylosanthis]